MNYFRKLFTVFFVMGIVVLSCITYGWTQSFYYTEKDLFDYDYDLPANFSVNMTEENELYELYILEFDSIWDTRVDATLMIPSKGVPPYRCIVYIHDYSENKYAASAMYYIMAENEYCVLSLNARYYKTLNALNPGIFEGYVFKGREDIVGTVVDHNRALEYLAGRLDLAAGDITLVGRGVGGVVATILAGSNDRVSGLALIDTGGDWPGVLDSAMGNDIHSALMAKYQDNKAKYLKLVQLVMMPVDPLNWIGKTGDIPVLLVETGRNATMGRQGVEKLNECVTTPQVTIVKRMSGTSLFGYLAGWKQSMDNNDEAEDKERINAPINVSEYCIKHIKHEFNIPESVYYGYDADLPLMINRTSMESESSHYERFMVAFKGIHDVDTEIEIKLPVNGQAPYPAVIFLHGSEGSAYDSDLMAEMLSRNGVAIISLIKGEGIKEAGKKRSKFVERQAIFDIFRIMDVMGKISEIDWRAFTIMGESDSAVIATRAAFMDERIAALIIMDIDVENEDYEEDENEVGMGGFSEVEEKLKNLKNVHIMVLDTINRDDGGEKKIEMLYEAAREPKEMVKAEKESTFMVSKILKSVVVFLESAYSSSETGLRVTRTFPLDVDQLDEIAGMKYSEKGEDETAVRELNTVNMSRGGKKEILIRARLRGPDNKGATVSAIVEKENGWRGYVHLVDNGKGPDPRADDGEYSGVLHDAHIRNGERYEVMVGGVGSEGGDIAGMQSVKTFNTD